MPVQPRVDLEALPDYVAGKTVPGAIKLSSNETPDGPLPSVARAIAEATTNLNRYPDPTVGKLAARLAERAGLPAGQVAVGCGSVALCHQLMHAMCAPGEDVVFGWRAFETYPIAAGIANANSIKVPLDTRHTHDLDAMAAAITPRTRVVMVCNPNNPTGTAVRRAQLDAFLDKVPSDVLVVLDEAYREFVSDTDVPDGLDYVRTRENVGVLRTFSKAYGLAGLRVGYFAGPKQIAAALRKVYVPFSVNSLAQIAAMASLDAEDELLARCESIVAERDRVRAELIEAGYEVPDSQANFIWLPLGDKAFEFSEHTLANKVVVRAFQPDGVRVTISHPEENDLFLHAARSYRRSN